MAEAESLYNMGYEQGLKDALDKYDEIFRIASEIRIAVGCKTAKECWELARNGDIQVVKHGHWRNTGSGQECSVCGEIQYGYDSYRNYCANCGARMDEVDHDNENT